MELINQIIAIAHKIWNDNPAYVSIPVGLLAIFTVAKITQMAFSTLNFGYRATKSTVLGGWAVVKFLTAPLIWLSTKVKNLTTTKQQIAKSLNNRLHNQLSLDDIYFIAEELTTNKGKNLTSATIYNYAKTLLNLERIEGQKIKSIADSTSKLSSMQILTDIFDSTAAAYPLSKALLVLQTRDTYLANELKRIYKEHISQLNDTQVSSSPAQPTQPTPAPNQAVFKDDTIISFAGKTASLKAYKESIIQCLPLLQGSASEDNMRSILNAAWAKVAT